MKKALVFAILAVFMVALPASAAKYMSPPVYHPAEGESYPVFSCYPIAGAGAPCFEGFAQNTANFTVQGVPGVLCLNPPFEVVVDARTDLEVWQATWRNFIRPELLAAGGAVKNVVLCKAMPEVLQCYDVYSAQPGYPGFCQQGSDNVRTWWPLLFDAPGTTWNLTVTSGTTSRVNGLYVHQDIWSWQLESSLETLQCLIRLFCTLPYGLCEVPLISGRVAGTATCPPPCVPPADAILEGTFLCDVLLDQLDEAIALYNQGIIVAPVGEDSASQALYDFEELVMDFCAFEYVCDARAGLDPLIANNDFFYPVCCKLLADTEWTAYDLGIFVQGD